MALAALAVAALALGAAASDVCPGGLSGTGYVKGGSCYEFVANEMTWVSAQSHCHSRGGRLAAITSAEIQKWISSKAATVFEGYQGVWIGLNDRTKEGSFVWDNNNGMSDATSGYTNWNRGEPDDGWFGQDCVYMRRSYDWRWDDLECSLPFFRGYNFICEYSVVPSTVPTTLSRSTTLASSPSTSLATTVVPSTVNARSENVTAVTALITMMFSATVTTWVRPVANEQPSSSFRMKLDTDALSSQRTTAEPPEPASSSTDLGMSSQTRYWPVNSTPISSSKSSDSRLLANTAMTENETSTSSRKTTVSNQYQSISGSDNRTGTTESSHAIDNKARNDFEDKAAADKPDLPSANAATQSEASTSTETTVSYHWQSPNNSELGARQAASQQINSSPDLPIYMSVIAILLLGVVAAIAVLGYKVYQRRQRLQRPAVGIENPLY